MRRPVGVTRRRVLMGSVFIAAAALAGCTRPRPEPDPSPSPDPDQAAILAALAREDELIAAYVGSEATGPETVTRHELHRAALMALLPMGLATESGVTPTPSPSGSAALVQLEAAAAEAGRVAADQVESGELAALLASIAAAEGAHVVELQG